MSNILIAVATMIIGFVLTTYGAYAGYYSLSRSTTVMRVQSSLERQLVYIDAAEQDLGRVPAPDDLVMSRITGESRFGLDYSYTKPGAVGLLCVQSARNDYTAEALEIVAEQRPGALYGSTCNTSSGPSASSVSLTVRID